MLDRRRNFLAGASGLAVIAGLYGWRRPSTAAQRSFEIQKTDAEWRSVLTPDQFTSCAGAQRNYLVQAHLIMNDAMERFVRGMRPAAVLFCNKVRQRHGLA